MLPRRFVTTLVIFLFVISVISTSSIAGNKSNNSDKKGDVSWSWADEQGPAKVGVPVHWTRTVAIDNAGDKEKKIDIKNFPKNTKLIQNNPQLEYHSRNVKYIAPVGASTIIIDYETPAPTATIKVTTNNATHYLFDFIIDADTNVHYADVDMPVDVPGLSWNWNYFINWKQPDGSFARQKVYAANSDGDRTTYEKLGWRAPHLSEQQGGGGGQKSPSKIRNYDLETVRGANNSLPELWYYRGNADTALDDDLVWPYLPVSSPGYQSGTSLLITSGVHDGRIYAEPINGTDATFSMEFKYKPDFSKDFCEIAGGAEILFGNGEGDTSYTFSVSSADGTWSSWDYDIATEALGGGWNLVKMNSTAPVPSDEYIRFYFSTESCASGNSLLIDDIIIN